MSDSAKSDTARYQGARISSRMDEDDWMDVMESEFVDFTESHRGTKIAFVFEHEEIGLHGFQFEKDTGTLRPCAFNRQEDSE